MPALHPAGGAKLLRLIMVAPARFPRLSRRGSVPDVRQAREDLLERGALPVGVRGMVADSWLRSAAAGVNADNSPPPITLAPDLLADYRAGHPLGEIFPPLDDRGRRGPRAPTRPGGHCAWTRR